MKLSNSKTVGKYYGEWKSNKIHGFGVFQWASGKSYVGEWDKEMKSGIGRLTFKQGNEYAG